MQRAGEAETYMLLLCAPPSDWKSGSVVQVASVAGPKQKKRVIERAGRGYQMLVSKDEYIDIELEEKLRKEAMLKRRESRRKFELPDHANLEDKYALLGLSAKHVLSTEEDIRNAYRRVSLAYHPDKAPPDQREEAETMYKAMQDAYDTLIDPARRRIYDSTREFDDTIPLEDEGTGKPEDFFHVYRPVFQRNSWFSKIKPVPDLGDMNTPDADVHEFYNFWLAFSSWREFKHEDEHKIEDADSREERRWMERENRKLVAEQVKKEKKRVRRMVKNAMKIDPRLLRLKQRAKEEKEARKRAKNEARLKREADKKAIEQAEKEKKEREERAVAEKEAQEKQEKEAYRKIRKKFRHLLKKEYDLSKFDVDTLVERLSRERLASFYEELEIVNEDGKEAIQRELKRIEKEKKEMEIQREREKEEKVARQRREQALQEEMERKRSKWSDIELMWLAKAVTKYPSGCHNRWGQIREMVNLMAKNPPEKERTDKEVIKQVRLMNQQKLSTGFSTAYAKKFKFAAGDNTDFDSAPSPVEAAASAPATGDAPTGTAPSSESGKGKKKSSKKTSSSSSTSKSSSIKKASSSDAAAEGKEGKRKKSSKKRRSKKESAKARVSETDTIKEKAGQEAAQTNTNEWSAVQQAALEDALRTVPKGPERWDQIAAKVSGKTKKDCVRRFKEIRSKILAQRASK